MRDMGTLLILARIPIRVPFQSLGGDVVTVSTTETTLFSVHFLPDVCGVVMQSRCQ